LSKVIFLTISILVFLLAITLGAYAKNITFYKIILKNGGSYKVRHYYRTDGEYCFYKSFGKVCFPESSVASVKKQSANHRAHKRQNNTK